MNCDKEMLLTSQRAATILFQAGVDFEANWPSGVRVYKRVNEEQMKMVSSILTSKKPKTEEVPCKAEHKASTPEDDSSDPEEKGWGRSRRFQFINCSVQIL
ncbi:uncharacterized protein LOC124287290 isoform X2 [Haliotis rubra]|uniref:uncharacterized protein LOC124287290 isoform X2 n=1 Tax=Haliotis rubra TaxID=36100 RepID=UPI001EE5ABA0|nr:uncharacterized protein LOC124287290 isoform X2 [Haliotis rubra]